MRRQGCQLLVVGFHRGVPEQPSVRLSSRTRPLPRRDSSVHRAPRVHVLGNTVGQNRGAALPEFEPFGHRRHLIHTCPRSCNVCRHTLPRATKCQRDPAEPPIVQAPGGINYMFERIVADPDIRARYSPQVMSRDPWIVVFENFATRAHWDFLETELRDQFEGSTVVGGMDDNGQIERQTLNTRTSSNAWCNLDSCYRSSVHRDLQDRLIGILGPSVGRHHMEALQVLKYREGQFYHPHHDTIVEQIHSWAGPRMLNAFIYFNDKPDGGGETEFTLLQPPLKVKPKVGRMVLWASQRDNDSLVVDDRTTHQACNVTHGTKEAANLWVHLYDFQTASHMGC
mmetsp:Transcript_3237/g.9879  ORF Transcript_3237/g.9879 Transcript_3237/m.9879 type:complete len:340 (+) Transcript_3237:164-1183(+)